MSSHNYSYSGQPNYYPSNSATYSTIPQYTQSQIDQYYAQYQCYPPQPFQIIPDYYVQPVSVAQDVHQPTTSAQLGYEEWQARAGPYDSQNQVTFQSPPRSNSQTMYAPGVSSRSLTPSDSHYRRTWTCDISGCTSNAQFTRLADLQRHQATVHGVGTPEYPCSVPHCSRVGDKGFTRRDHLVEHLRSYHHLNIPKRRPGERSAFPFGWPEGYHSSGSGTS